MMHSTGEKSPEIRDEVRRSLFQHKTTNLSRKEYPSENEAIINEKRDSTDEITELLHSLQQGEVGHHTRYGGTCTVPVKHKDLGKKVEESAIQSKSQNTPSIPIPNVIHQPPTEKPMEQPKHLLSNTINNHEQPTF